MRSASAKRRDRKGPTSGRVEGPPMFMNTRAVGPLREVEDWVTGGEMTVARERVDVGWCHGAGLAGRGSTAEVEAGSEERVCLGSRFRGARRAMVERWEKSEGFER